MASQTALIASTNGTTWTTPDNPMNYFPAYNGALGISWNGSYFLACASKAAGGIYDNLCTSTDGVHWSTVSMSPTDLYLAKVAWSPTLNMWAGVGNGTGSDAQMAVATSTDGINWTVVDNSALSVAGGYTAFSFVGDYVCWMGIGSGGLFVCAGHGTDTLGFSQYGALTSPDGVNWTMQFTNGLYFDRVAWNRSTSSPEVIATGQGFGSTPLTVQSSPDGVAWTAQTLIYGNAYGGPDCDGSTYWTCGTIDGGTDKAIVTEPFGGSTWTGRSSPADTGFFWEMYQTGYSPGLSQWVSCGEFIDHPSGNFSTVMTAANPTSTWTTRPNAMDTGMANDVCWASGLGLWIVAGQGPPPPAVTQGWVVGSIRMN